MFMNWFNKKKTLEAYQNSMVNLESSVLNKIDKMNGTCIKDTSFHAKHKEETEREKYNITKPYRVKKL